MRRPLFLPMRSMIASRSSARPARARPTRPRDSSSDCSTAAHAWQSWIPSACGGDCARAPTARWPAIPSWCSAANTPTCRLPPRWAARLAGSSPATLLLASSISPSSAVTPRAGASWPRFRKRYTRRTRSLCTSCSTRPISGRRSGRLKAGKACWVTSRKSCAAAACAASSRGLSRSGPRSSIRTCSRRPTSSSR
jgi:hypothetical protein